MSAGNGSHARVSAGWWIGWLLGIVCALPACHGRAPATKASPPAFMTAAADLRPQVRATYGVRAAWAATPDDVVLMIGASVNPKAAAMADAYRIISADDPRYAYDRFVRPAHVRVQRVRECRTPAGSALADGWRTDVTLRMPQPLRTGCTYAVVAQGSGREMVTAARCAAPVQWGAPAHASADTQAVLGLRRIESCGVGILGLECGPAFAPAQGDRPEAYTVTINGQACPLLTVSRRTFLEAYVPVGWPYAALPAHEVFLHCAMDVPDGATVSVAVAAQALGGTRTQTRVVNARTDLAQSIKANQLGYLPDAPVKRAYLGRWLGGAPRTPGARDEVTMHALSLTAAPPFYLCAALSGAPVFTGRADMVQSAGTCNEGIYHCDHAGENVYALDFSAWCVTGQYYLHVPGIGRSLPFAIAPDVYVQAFATQAFGVYAQRCGIALAPPHSPWRRIACHTNGLTLVDLPRASTHALKDLPKHVVRRAGLPVVLPATGGHHDAGDYNPRSHLDVAAILLDVYESAPRKFYDGQLCIPENTNGIPDIVDEALWALQLWRALQDDDGGVYGGTESAGDPNFIQTVELDPGGDYVYPKEAAASFAFAGVMANLTRVMRSLGRTQEAAACLQRAERAYDWARQHPPATTSDFARHEQFSDPYAFAAAQLLLTTRAPRYNQDFLAQCVWRTDLRASLERWKTYDQRDAAWAYARCQPADTDAALQRRVRAKLIATADKWIANARTMGYAFIRHPNAPVMWGTGGAPVWLDECRRAHILTSNNLYRTWMLRTCDYALGANPLGRSFIVGLGPRCVRAPLHNSRYAPAGEVVAGMQVQGPHQNGDGYRVKETVFPPVNPRIAPLYTFADAHFAIAMDEGTVKNMVKTMAAFGYLLPDRSSP